MTCWGSGWVTCWEERQGDLTGRGSAVGRGLTAASSDRNGAAEQICGADAFGNDLPAVGCPGRRSEAVAQGASGVS